jgi:hypothetical protein
MPELGRFVRHIWRGGAGGSLESVALIAMTFPNEKSGMRVEPLLVSREPAQRSGGLPTLIPFR